MTSGRFVVMGVSGCGKSHIGAALANELGLTFVDGDDLHPAGNIAKMSRGEPLDDHDRAPWLDCIGQALQQGNTIIGCSALKRAYRTRIGQQANAPVTFLFLRGQRQTLIERMAHRPGHFMPVSLLDSQLATLEMPGADERVVVADIEREPAEIVAILVAGIKEMKA